jgi:hypothetical protein
MAKATTATMRRSVGRYGPLQIAITVLVAATALVHLYLGAGFVISLMGPASQTSGSGSTATHILGLLFLCNFGGYVVLVLAHYLPVLRRYQSVTRALLIGFTAVTFVAYFAVQRGHALNPFGLADKAVEAALMVLLVIEGRRARV